MGSAIKKVNKIIQIVRLKQLMQRWKNVSVRRRSVYSHSDSDSDSDSSFGSVSVSSVPAGYLAVYVGAERRRFVIPTRFLNLPIFVHLLNESVEEFGYQNNGGLVLPCDADFFGEVVKLLEREEHEAGGLGLNDFLSLLSEAGHDSCKGTSDACHVLTPLLQKARV